MDRHLEREPPPVRLDQARRTDPRIDQPLLPTNQSLSTLELVAALDWEQATLSSRELDLGWWLFSRRTHGEGLGIALPPGFPSREQDIARYEELTGEPVRHIEFYEVLNGLIGAIAVMRIGDTMIRAGALPADSPMPSVNPASVALAGLLGEPVPTGEVTSWATG
jgi:hypothetical protein